MTTAAAFSSGNPRREAIVTEVGSVGLGAAVTFGLFFAIAHFKTPPAPMAPPIEDLRAVSLPPEPPPPKLLNPTPPSESTVPFAGLEVGASDSTVKIAVLPPDLDALVPKSHAPPPAVIQTAQLITNFKPKAEANFDFDHVFQPSEVDQRTAVLARPVPRWPSDVPPKTERLRVVFLMVVNTHGQAESVRLLNPSASPSFNEEVAAQIREEWVFSPAMKNGRKVRCLVQQAVVLSQQPGRSPFEL